MLTPWRVILCLAVVGGLLVVVAPTARAQAQAQKPPEQFGYATGAVTKLGRGFVNLVTGWTELIVQPWRGVQAEGAKGVPIGIGKGLGLSVLRTLSGAYEIATCAVPVPPDWEPPIKPGFGLPGYEAAGTPGP